MQHFTWPNFDLITGFCNLPEKKKINKNRSEYYRQYYGEKLAEQRKKQYAKSKSRS